MSQGLLALSRPDANDDTDKVIKDLARRPRCAAGAEFGGEARGKSRAGQARTRRRRQLSSFLARYSSQPFLPIRSLTAWGCSQGSRDRLPGKQVLSSHKGNSLNLLSISQTTLAEAVIDARQRSL